MSRYTQMLHILYEYRRADVAYEIILKMKEMQIRINSDDYMDAIRVCSAGKNADSIAVEHDAGGGLRPVVGGPRDPDELLCAL